MFITAFLQLLEPCSEVKSPYCQLSISWDLVRLESLQFRVSYFAHNPYYLSLREKCPYLVFFWPAFFRIRTDYGKMQFFI